MCVKLRNFLSAVVLCCWPLLLKCLSCTRDGFWLLSTPVVMRWWSSVSPPLVFCHTLVAVDVALPQASCFSFFLWKSGLGFSPLLLTTFLVIPPTDPLGADQLYHVEGELVCAV